MLTCECGEPAIARGMCRSCYDAAYYEKNRERVLANKRAQRRKIQAFIRCVKGFASCARCDEGDPACLQFHHEDDKEFAIGEAQCRIYSLETLKDEMRKCVVLCANCHLKEHSGQVSG